MAAERPTWITLQQAMDLLGVSRSTIDRWRRNKQLPYIKIGKEVFFEPGRIMEWTRQFASAGPEKPSASPEPVTVGIGYQSKTALMWSPILIRALNLFDNELAKLRYRHPVRVEWYDADNGLELVEGMIAGRVNIASLGDYPIVVSQTIGSLLPSFRAVLLAFDGKSPGGRGISIALSPGVQIRRFADLSAVTVSTVVHSSAGYRLHKLIEESGASDWKVVHQEMGESWNGIVGRKIGASVMWEPYISLARYLGAGQLFYAEGIGEDYLTGVVAEGHWAERNSDIVCAYVKAHLKAHRWLRERPLESATIVARTTGLPLDVVLDIIRNVRWDAVPYNRDMDTLRRIAVHPVPFSSVQSLYAKDEKHFDYLHDAVHALGLPPISSDLLRGDWVEEATY
ncbi:excisionase family DNA-binding domain-containing protein [Paenibacillus sp. 32O-W]|uniref:helix-turn-helix domain-containing protein n=1 Tax=Paenibacillus sp. 32O-W TaxID=1695218 RepID=UPI00071EEC12|nr:helix-turn-helix domain-containing protein [Paenibacillus sp. 32O-W]ALS25806.1 excisionase family DNA-binding domain-containing protein [Paenibacillus sp. 32O-W]